MGEVVKIPKSTRSVSEIRRVMTMQQQCFNGGLNRGARASIYAADELSKQKVVRRCQLGQNKLLL